MKRKEQNGFWGAVFLIAGCCVGAGMLGLPLVSRRSGFLLSLPPLFIGWGYMYLSGLMLLEVFADVKQKQDLIGLLTHFLGKWGRWVGTALFLFLFYLILTAYFNAFSLLGEELFRSCFHLSISRSSCTFICFICVFLLSLPPIRTIDFFNRCLVICLILFFICLVILGSLRVELNCLMRMSHPQLIFGAIPVYILSFGFQNLIPSISHYLNHRAKKIKRTLFMGTLFALLLYFIWNLVILGMGSLSHFDPHRQDLSVLFSMPKEVLFFMKGFSFCALLTSIFTVSVSFVHFLANSPHRKHCSLFALIALLPPTLFSLFNPNLFLIILKVAGGIGAIGLYGILPSLMLWKKRYLLCHMGNQTFPFGKGVVRAFPWISLGVILIELFQVMREMV